MQKLILLLAVPVIGAAAFLYAQANRTSPLPPALTQALMRQPRLPQIPFTYKITLPGHLRGLKIFSTTPPGNPLTDDGATLGRVLFYDRGLSANGLVSCASCHSQEIGFDDANRFSIGLSGKITKRHSVGLAFAGYNANGRQFRDEHVASLEEQVLEPVHDPVEMGMKQGQLVARVTMRDWYAPLFENAYGSKDITEAKIARALAQFVRSMVNFNAPYDQARTAVKTRLEPFPAFSTLQNTGKSLFLTSSREGGYGCAACHEGEAFLMLKRHNNGLDTLKDTGPDNALLRGASLRNIAVRQPYMHDGRFNSLGKVVDHYSNAIKPHPQLGVPLRDKHGEPVRFSITVEQKSALLAFLETLTDKGFLTDVKFSNPFNRLAQ